VQCPKDKQVELVNSKLKGQFMSGQLNVHHCPSCEGMWLPVEEYKTWQADQPPVRLADLPKTLDIDYTPDSHDTQGALCPECHAYLARAKVSLKNPFYVERCVNCGGIWCDRGEWHVLEIMGVHTVIEYLFLNEWQTRMRERDYFDRERRATMDKLGEELGNRVFELAELLENHPNGDFGVAYLMRRFDK